MTASGYQLRRSSTCAENDYDDPANGVIINNSANRSNLYANRTTGYIVSPATSMIFNARGVLDSGDNIIYTVSDGITE
jgi:hypothetical protein